MPTPELQNYISQQRSAGVSDAQIRQALATQGWTEVDLSQAFGGFHITSGTPRVSHKTLWILISTALVVLILGYIGYGYYTRYKAGLQGCCGDAKISSQGVVPQPSTSAGLTAQKLCGNWPVSQQDNNYLDGAKFFSKIDASTTANGILLYLNATKIIEINTAAGERTIQQVLMCAKATAPASIKDYYKKMAGYTVADTASLPAGYNNANLNLGSLHPQTIIQNSSGQLLMYDAGGGDILLFYVYK